MHEKTLHQGSACVLQVYPAVRFVSFVCHNKGIHVTAETFIVQLIGQP